jgi:hypothetical protein
LIRCQWAAETCRRSGWTKRRLCREHEDLAVELGLESDYPTSKELSRNPMVCVCPSTDADLRFDYGQCARCGRKPLSLFAPHLRERLGIR